LQQRRDFSQAESGTENEIRNPKEERTKSLYTGRRQRSWGWTSDSDRIASAIDREQAGEERGKGKEAVWSEADGLIRERMGADA